MHWHNKQFSHQTKPKIVLDSQMLAFDILDYDSWLVAPLSVANSLKEIFNDVYVIPFTGNPPKRTIYMINHKNPLKSNREIIDKIRSHIELCIPE